MCGDEGQTQKWPRTPTRPWRTALARLGCSVQVVDPDLWNLLRGWGLATSKSLRLGFFNVFDLGARAMLEEVPPFDASPDEADTGADGAARTAAAPPGGRGPAASRSTSSCTPSGSGASAPTRPAGGCG